MPLIEPHRSDKLMVTLPEDQDIPDLLEKAKSLKKISVSSQSYSDLLMMGIGAYTPLTKFMGHDDWLSVCKDMKMSNGVFWPIPITLSISKEEASSIKAGDEVCLYCESCERKEVGILTVEEIYERDLKLEVENVFGTTDEAHPGVAVVLKQGKYTLSGEVICLSQGDFPEKFGELYRTPQEVRDEFESSGWSNVTAFQTRNPMHMSHEFLAKIALEFSDGILVHSLLGNLKAGDFPPKVSCAAIKALVKHYFKENTVMQAGYPLDMRYAGPREALLHALFRQNYGCNKIVIGRDHAGVGSYYHPFAAQRIFEEIPDNALKIKPLTIDWTFWCYKCETMVSAKSCPHPDAEHLKISGTKLRELLSNNEEIPEHFSRPEVLVVLQEYYKSL